MSDVRYVTVIDAAEDGALCACQDRKLGSLIMRRSNVQMIGIILSHRISAMIKLNSQQRAQLGNILEYALDENELAERVSRLIVEVARLQTECQNRQDRAYGAELQLEAAEARIRELQEKKV